MPFGGKFFTPPVGLNHSLLRPRLAALGSGMEINIMTRKEKIAALVSGAEYTPISAAEIAAELKVPEKSFPHFMKEIEGLMSEGVIIDGKKGRLYSAERAGLIKGSLRVNPKGFGFVVRSDAGGNDIYVSGDNFHGAVNDDEVLVRMIKSKSQRPEGEIYSVLRRGTLRAVGTLKLYAGLGIVTPDNEKLPREIFVSPSSKAMDGQKVVVKITDYLRDGSLHGVIDEVIGYPDDFGVDVLSIIKSYDFDIDFPKKVSAEAADVSETILSGELEGRLDLRGKQIITIDGDDSKDLDDAISLEKTENGWRLGVHIADVSHYVRPKSYLDKEALSRGTSVYLVDRVIPMLPPRLSNGICSLNEGVDRLTLSVFINMDPDGRAVKSEFYKSVIRSAHRMTYNNVWKLLTGSGGDLEEKYADILPMLKNMHELSKRLKALARERGYIELEVPEAKAVLDEGGRAVGIELRKTNGATELIEQFMVSANMAVAEYLQKKGIPAIYRVHDMPDEGKVKALRSFAGMMGYSPKLSLQGLVDKADGTPESGIISAMVLRSMAKARYSPKNTGHYGLGAEYYCHFTSPIRRYPDLVCHRALKAAIEKDSAAVRGLERMNSSVADASSEREVAAERCERDVLDMKKAEYMEQFVGCHFCGIISSVTSFGFFVVLPDTVEGLVSVTSLSDDYYVYDEDSLSLRGERLHREYRVGDEIEVTLVSSNKQNRKIEFVVKGMENKKPRPVKLKEEKSNGGKQRRKNTGAKQKRVPRVFHRRKNRGRH